MTETCQNLLYQSVVVSLHHLFGKGIGHTYSKGRAIGIDEIRVAEPSSKLAAWHF